MGSLCEASRPSPALPFPEHLDVDVLTHPEAHHLVREFSQRLTSNPVTPFLEVYVRD